MSATTTPTTTTHRLIRAASAAALGLVAALGVASPALAHDELIDTSIVTDAQGSAEAVKLTFNNSIVQVGTEFIVQAEDGSDATDGAPEVDGPSVIQPLAVDLAPGSYSAAWRVVSSDGHPIEGSFGITVAADGSAEVGETTAGSSASVASEEDEHDHADHDHADHATTDAEEEPSGVPVGALIAVVIGGAAVIAAGLAAATAGRRRRARAMAADAQQAPADQASTDQASTDPASTSTENGTEDQA